MKISRREMHQLLWSQPATRVAKMLNISSSALSKTCALRDIPTPPRGYWGKVNAGADLPVALLPHVDAELPLPWDRSPTVEKALKRLASAPAAKKTVGRPAPSEVSVTDATRQSWKAMEKRAPREPIGATPPMNGAAGGGDTELELARQMATLQMDLERVIKLCAEVLEASRHQPADRRSAVRGWAERVLAQVEAQDPVAQIIEQCAQG